MPEPAVVLTEVDGHRLRLTHLDKVLYPATGWTKAAALHYYAQAAPMLLPHLAGRPVTFLRCPEGVDGQRFWAKNAPAGTPDWVRLREVEHREGATFHPMVDDLATLVWAANLAALEFHVPQWRESPAVHDRLIVDLDPGEGCTIVHCCAVALLARAELAADGLTAWPKTSGSKGIHLCVPLPDTPEEAATRYARTLATRLRQANPDLVIDRMDKRLRRGKVFVDWSQNNSAKNTVAPYSLRTGPAPTVSAPLTWPEVAACRSPEDLDFTPEQVLERGDLFVGLA